MKLASLLSPSLIFFHIEGNTREEIYKGLLERMSRSMALPGTPGEISRGMVEREDSFGIVYEGGFCFPHMRHPKLDDLNIGIGILDRPVQLKKNDKSPTRIVICCLISETTSVIYLKALAAFSKFILQDQSGVEKLADSGSPDAFLDVLRREKVEVKHTLCAEDIMHRPEQILSPDAPVSEALDILTSDKRREVAVVAANGNFMGLISSENIIRRAIPEYIMRLENLNFLSQFEPFDNLLKEESRLTVKDLLFQPREVSPETPLIQLTIMLVKENISCLAVVDNSRRLLGIITISELINNVLRG